MTEHEDINPLNPHTQYLDPETVAKLVGAAELRANGWLTENLSASRHDMNGIHTTLNALVYLVKSRVHENHVDSLDKLANVIADLWHKKEITLEIEDAEGSKTARKRIAETMAVVDCLGKAIGIGERVRIAYSDLRAKTLQNAHGVRA